MRPRCEESDEQGFSRERSNNRTRSGLSSILGLDWGSLFVSGWMTGRVWDACASLFPACSHYHWTKRGPSIRPGTKHGPRPYPKLYLTSGQEIFFGFRSYLPIGNHQTCQMRGSGASLFSPFEPYISAFGTRWGQRILHF